METKYTKGPWKASDARKQSNFGGYTAHVAAYVPDPCQPGKECVATIAKVLGGPEDEKKVAETNAALIAAAPDLYEACAMQQRLIDDMARFVGQMALQDYALFNEAPIKARAALAKARRD
jgi:hypothetical protein